MEESSKKPIVAVVGPTASGKTSLAIKIAKEFSGEIINLDSMQIYKYLDIGTAKPDENERGGIPHHVLDCVEPTEPFSASDYGVLAKNAIEDIHSRAKLPVICGGTGLYLDACLYGYNMSQTACDEKLREKYYKIAREEGNEKLFELLKKCDPKSADEIHPNNVKRVVRALEIYELTGIPKSEQTTSCEPLFNTLIFGIEWERDVLYERINQRVDKMLENGLENEVRTLIKEGKLPLDLSTQSSQAIGYKEMIAHIKGEATLEEATENIKMNSRRYAKRQLTWFKRNEDIIWLNGNDEKAPEIALTYVKNLLKGR